MKYVKDNTGRFRERPHYESVELDRECEAIISAFLKQKFGELRFPIPTDVLEVLIEKEVQDFDPYANLSLDGEDVEGVTEFIPGQKPKVKISKQLSEQSGHQNRYRTTLTHEFGHVKFHAPLWQVDMVTGDLFGKPSGGSIKCKREYILSAPENYDWMEWQAGYICGAILMPHTHVKRIARECLGMNGLAGPIDIVSPSASDLINRITEEFQVSADAARIRLLKLKVFTEAKHGVGLFG